MKDYVKITALKCTMCAAPLEFPVGSTTCVCKYCGTEFVISYPADPSGDRKDSASIDYLDLGLNRKYQYALAILQSADAGEEELRKAKDTFTSLGNYRESEWGAKQCEMRLSRFYSKELKSYLWSMEMEKKKDEEKGGSNIKTVFLGFAYIILVLTLSALACSFS